MDPKQIRRTLDLIIGQHGTITQHIIETQVDLTEFCRQAEERLDHIERIGNEHLYTPLVQSPLTWKKVDLRTFHLKILTVVTTPDLVGNIQILLGETTTLNF
ncbi:hypothetical protein MA16_Dca027607 [Dendrobium catenatum]|uniref:Uncharacterized protein n=1 Tax=Dendrobium catenatum TaxID=906689 RepID=A0A2I0V7Y0_9ASPA|nr:hypothetical protein MA16_Dca027607 [Dendrobium catenatum]